MNRNESSRTDRGQAYTLEGFVGAVIVLTAVLFALQSVVITPTTGGSVDRTVQAQLEQEAQDALVVAESEGALSHLVRNWNESEGEYHNPMERPSGLGNYTTEQLNESDVVGSASTFGEILEKRFEESGRSYNVEVVYRDGKDPDSFYMVYQGQPSPNAFSSGHMVTLYENQRLTAPGSEHLTLEEAQNEEYPIPNVGENADGNLYNVVEVRLTVW
ncbi:hypothetical protein OB955_03405 [Halobacteria archaeon AArc-m2/3/4]|uniref:Uncharacterized protein n=1 Tax=Natronoglomus mannanivorans TaxID=2979990 RepID=A0ABT2QA22_9EURY|nr:hypothetical protein [Halobacteria archaeon AArc-m2/3/4]